MLAPQIAGSREDASGHHLRGLLPAVAAACLTTGAMLEVRRLSTTERPTAIVFYFLLVSSLGGPATCRAGWVPPSPRDAGLLVAVGIADGLGQILLTLSYRAAEASLVAQFEYVTLLLAAGIGWLLFGEVPGPTFLPGAAALVGSGSYLLHAERRP